MSSREKVIKGLKGLECCVDPLKAHCFECQYYPCYDQDTTSEKLIAAALELLKAQEPVEPWTQIDIKPNGTAMIVRCGACHTELAQVQGGASLECVHENIKYCFHCGRAVKWDDRQGERDKAH